jgi:hypothetical protein
MAATLTATPEPTNGPPRIRLNVTISSGTGVSVFLTRLDPDGRTQVVRLADPAVMTGTAWVGYDYEAAYGANVTYTAVVTSSGSVVQTVSASATLTVGDVWLIHPGVPSLSMMLAKVTSLGDRVRPVNRGVFEPFGRPTPLVVTDGTRKAVQASLTIRTRTLEELAALVGVLADSATLLLNVPVSLGWGVANEYVSIGDLVETREVETGNDPCRIFTAPYLVVSRPVGGSQSQRTWADVITENATWQVVLDKYASWLGVLAPGSDMGIVAETPPGSGLYPLEVDSVESPPGSGLYTIGT